jgi:hypothetical protein
MLLGKVLFQFNKSGAALKMQMKKGSLVIFIIEDIFERK